MMDSNPYYAFGPIDKLDEKYMGIPQTITELSGVDALRKGVDLTAGDRQKTHGDWCENHQRIADLWSAYLKTEIKASDVTRMMVLLKMARMESGTLNTDDYVDGAVYLARTLDCVRKEQDGSTQ